LTTKAQFAALAICLLLAPSASAQSSAKAAQKPTSGVTAAGAAVPTWAEMEALLRKEWATRHPKETIIKIEKVGDPTYSDEPGKTETFSGTSSSGVENWEDWSWHESSWSTTIKGREGSYLRQKVDVTAERANKTKAKFSVAALYKLTGKTWQFAEMPVGKVEELAGGGSPQQPSDAEAAQIFKAAWSNIRPDFNVLSIKVQSKEFNQSKGNVWLTYKLAISVVGSAKASAKYKGNKFLCTPPSYSSVLKWDATKSAWAADENPIRDINEDSQCDKQ
jgi:hypothetical protein